MLTCIHTHIYIYIQRIDRCASRGLRCKMIAPKLLLALPVRLRSTLPMLDYILLSFCELFVGANELLRTASQRSIASMHSTFSQLTTTTLSPMFSTQDMSLDRLEQRRVQLMNEIQRKKKLLAKLDDDERNYLYVPFPSSVFHRVDALLSILSAIFGIHGIFLGSVSLKLELRQSLCPDLAFP
jgi:hypothetical protein